MKKYRKKIYVCLTLSALALATGCSNKAIKANAENTENVVSSTQAENTGEASAQTLVEKAKITFSDSGAQIEGSGASYADGTLTITEAGSYTLGEVIPMHKWLLMHQKEKLRLFSMV